MCKQCVNCEDLGMVCNNSSGECVECMINDDCPTGKVCNDNHICIVDTDPCDGVQCDGGQCVDGKCICPPDKPYGSDSGVCYCPPNMACGIPSTDESTTVNPCDNIVCSAGKQCVNGVCVCPAGMVCDGTSTAVPTDPTTPSTDESTDPTTPSTDEPTTTIPEPNCEKTCELGDILWSDKKCYGDCLIYDKTAIGIVVNVEKRLALSYYGRGVSTNNWVVSYNKDIWGVPALTDCTSVSACPSSGKDNTQKILNWGSSSGAIYDAALTTKHYSTDGTSEGQWFLPSIVEMATVIDNCSKIEAGLNNGVMPTTSFCNSLNECYWTSSEASSTEAWFFNLYTKTVNYKDKGSICKTWPALIY